MQCFEAIQWIFILSFCYSASSCKTKQVAAHQSQYTANLGLESWLSANLLALHTGEFSLLANFTPQLSGSLPQALCCMWQVYQVEQKWAPSAVLTAGGSSPVHSPGKTVPTLFLLIVYSWELWSITQFTFIQQNSFSKLHLAQANVAWTKVFQVPFICWLHLVAGGGTVLTI